MSQVLLFLLIGVGAGGLIAGTGMGVVLSYRGSGLINLAAGAIAMLCGYCFWALRTGYFGVTFDQSLSIVFTLGFAIVVALVFELLVVVPLGAATPLAKLVASLGFLVSAMAAVTIAFGPGARPQPAILPNVLIRLFGAPLLANRFLIAGIMFAIVVALVALYRFTRFGLGTRAASEHELHSMLAGLSPRRISLFNTILMALTMAVVGMLAASIQVLDPSDLPLLVVPALAAALFGRLSSLQTTFIAGVLLGMGQSLLVYLSTLSWFPNGGGVGNPLPGVGELLTFVVLLVAVYLRGGAIPGRGEVLERRLPNAPCARHPFRSTFVYGVPCGVALWGFPSNYRQSLIQSLIDVVLLLSIVLITGFVGQVSVVQLALGGVAGFTLTEVTAHAGFGFPLAPIVGVAGAGLLGFLMGIPALRVRGVSLVIVTLAAAVAIENFVFANNSVVGTGASVGAPSLFGFGIGPLASLAGLDGALPSPIFGWFVLVVVVATALLICNVRNSRVGQEMLAVRANERAAAGIGINVRNVKLIGFTLSATIAGVGGVLIAYSNGAVSPGSYDTVTALLLIAFAYIGGITTIPGAVLAGLIFTGNILTLWLQRWFNIPDSWTSLAAGIVLIGVLAWIPDGVAGALFYRARNEAHTSRTSRPWHGATRSPAAVGNATGQQTGTRSRL